MNSPLLPAWAATLRRWGDTPAIVQAADGASVTFRSLDARAAAWQQAHAPATRGLRGRAVVFAVPNGIAWFEIFLGLLKAGAVAVPLEAAEPLAAQRRLATELRAGGWWTGEHLEPLPRPKRFRDPAVCLLKLTSGSTGRPRALAFTALQMLADARQVAATMRITRRDLNYALIPLGHSYGLGSLVLPLLAHGTGLVVATGPLPHAIAADFARWRPTVFPGVPALWHALAASDLALPGLRLAISAGSALPPAVARAVAARFGQPLHNFYGSSETGGIAYDRTGRATLQGGVGRALRGVTLVGFRGAPLQVSSPAVVTQGNRRRVGRQGAWLMPDHVTLDPSGAVTLRGRRGPTLKLAGRRVNLTTVSERLRQLPGVREVWVGVGPGAEPVLAAVVATDGTAGELRTALRRDTAPWLIPKKLIVVPHLPLTARGKIDAPALQALAFPPPPGSDI